jgi:hypothetical protein
MRNTGLKTFVLLAFAAICLLAASCASQGYRSRPSKPKKCDCPRWSQDYRVEKRV